MLWIEKMYLLDGLRRSILFKTVWKVLIYIFRLSTTTDKSD